MKIYAFSATALPDNNKRSKLFKILLMMKLTSLLILVACLHVSAATFAQQVSLQQHNITLGQAFDKIKDQTGYIFFYNNDVLKGLPAIDVSVKDATLRQALDACLKGQPLYYTIVDKTVVIRRREPGSSPSTFFTPPPAAHDLRVHITDSLGSPLQGASVVVKGTKQGGQTDADGNITLAGLTGSETLIISYVGYETKEESVGDNTTLTIVLSATPAALDEVQLVSKGYYNTTKALNTGNVSVVKSDVIERQPVGDPMLALVGRVPGLQIAQQSGVPGNEVTVQLRGRNSIANGNDPLYVVDGIPYTSTTMAIFNPGAAYPSPFNNLNPGDIESITVLKDADATAIYGSRGANGVILITTKKGKAGKTMVNFNAYTGAGQVTKQLHLLNTQQYLAMRHRAFDNDGLTPGLTDYDINGTWDTTRYTDLPKLLIGNTSHITDVEGSLSGGNEQTQFTLGGGYHKETTVLPGDFYNRKYSFHTGITHTSVNKRFHAQFTASFFNNYISTPYSGLPSVYKAPDVPAVYDINGNLNWEHSTWQNPLAGFLNPYITNTDNLISNLLLSYRLLPGLTLQSGFGYNNLQLHQDNLQLGKSQNPQYVTPDSRMYTFGTNRNQSWSIEPQLSYTKKVSQGQLDILLGTTFQQNIANSIYQYAWGFSDDDQVENIGAASTIMLGGYQYSLYRYNAWYGRIGYNWEEKYVVNLTGRRDGSSRFGPGKQFGNFGAAGIAWIFSKEGFIRDHLSFISFGKLRASYGSTGNDQLGDYKYLSSYTSPGTTYQGVSGLYPTQIANPYYGWERVNKLEAGLELGIIKDRIHLEASWYRNRTGNQLVGYALPALAGFTSVQANLPAIVENSGWEFELNSTNIQRKDFNWTSSFNISFPRNKLIAYPNLAGSSYAHRFAIGYPLFVSFLYHYIGTDPQTGIYQFQDITGDNQATYPNDLQPVFVGTRFAGGLGNHIQYKGWELDVFFQFVKQTKQLFLFYGQPGSVYDYNQPVSFLDRQMQQMYTTQFGNTAASAMSDFIYTSDGNIGDASFIRLKNVSLSWQLPAHWQQALHIGNTRLYLQGQNLLTITGYKNLDPETGPSALPPIRMVTAGIRFSL